MNRLETALNFLFSPHGRLARGPYILFVLCVWVVSALVFRFLPPTGSTGAMIFLAVISICVTSRRWHDFNWRGWWLLLRFAPLPLFYLIPMTIMFLAVQIVPLLVLVVEAVVPGTKGPNRFGPVPASLSLPWTRKAKPAQAPLERPVSRSSALSPRPAPAKKAKPAARAAKPKVAAAIGRRPATKAKRKKIGYRV